MQSGMSPDGGIPNPGIQTYATFDAIMVRCGRDFGEIPQCPCSAALIIPTMAVDKRYVKIMKPGGIL